MGQAYGAGSHHYELLGQAAIRTDARVRTCFKIGYHYAMGYGRPVGGNDCSGSTSHKQHKLLSMNSICSATLPYLASWWLMLSAACPSIALYETCSPSAATSSYGVLLHSPTGTVDLCWRRRLLVGVPTLRGPGPKAPDILSVLLNKDRISHKLQKVRAEAKSTKGGDSLNLDEFAAFNADNPGLVVNSIVGKITVISIQQPLMLAELVKEMVVTSEPVNGVVSDTAHGFWRQWNCLLVVSSAYSRTLNCWIPGVLSYTNGATAKHYQHHFFALFKSIAQERARQGWDASGDEHFGTVRPYGYLQIF